MRCYLLGALVLVGCGSSSGQTADANDPPVADAAIDAVVPDGEDVVSGLVGPSALAVDATHFYISLGDRIVRCAIDGGPIETIATGQHQAGGFVLTADRLYWINHGYHAADFRDGSVRWTSKTGGGDHELATSYMPTALVLDGDTLYWAEGDGALIQRIGVDGTGRQTVDDSVDFKTGLAVAPAAITWATSTGVVAMDRATGARTPITTGEYGVWGLALVGADLFWTVSDLSGDGAIRVSRDGGSPVDLVPDEHAPSGVVADAGWLYWGSGDRIRRMAAGAGAVETFAAGVQASGLAFDEAYVYWTDHDRGAVVRKPK